MIAPELFASHLVDPCTRGNRHQLAAQQDSTGSDDKADEKDYNRVQRARRDRPEHRTRGVVNRLFRVRRTVPRRFHHPREAEPKAVSCASIRPWWGRSQDVSSACRPGRGLHQPLACRKSRSRTQDKPVIATRPLSAVRSS